MSPVSFVVAFFFYLGLYITSLVFFLSTTNRIEDVERQLDRIEHRLPRSSAKTPPSPLAP